MSKLISLIQDIIGIFQNYSKKDCSHLKLNKDELKLLIQNEFADVIKNPKDPNTISSLIQILDEDNDGEVDFNEFCDLLCKVLKAYYKVVYEKEDSCHQPSQPKEVVETTSDTTSKVQDEPPKFYQKPLYPKSADNIPSTYHDQKGVRCGDQSSKVETTQVSIQTDPRKADPVEVLDVPKEPTIKIEEISQTSTGNQHGKDQTPQPLDENPKSPQVYGEGKDTTTSYGQGKDQAKQETTETQSCNQGKDQTSPQGTTGSQSQGGGQQTGPTDQSNQGKYMVELKETVSQDQGIGQWVDRRDHLISNQSKDQISHQDTDEVQPSTHSQDKVPTIQPNTTVSQPQSGEDQTQGTSSSQSISHEQDKAKPCLVDTTSSDSQSQQHDSTRSQSVSSETSGSQSHHSEKSEHTTSSQSDYTVSHTTVDHPEEPKKFYQKPVYMPPPQGFGVAPTQPPPYTQPQQDPTPESHQVPQVPQQPQKSTFYQHKQTFSLQKKNP